MDKAVGSIFGAVASVTKILTIPGIVLTPEEIKTRIILAALVAIPGAIMGYIVTSICRSIHNKIKSRIEKTKNGQNQDSKKNKRSSMLIALLAVVLFASIPIFSCSGFLNDAQANLSHVHVNSKVKSEVRVAIIGGHGSIINNKYQTPGKQSPHWPNGLKIYEGFSTHQLAYDLASSLMEQDIDVDIITPSGIDISLYQRVFLANSLYKYDKRTVVISLHHNAQPNNGKADFCDSEGYYGWYSNASGGATGTEVYTSVGQTGSDELAEIIIRELKAHFPDMKMRVDLSDHDQDKEANFYVLRKTTSKAILIEWMFMTNFEDCKTIEDPEKRKQFIQALTCAISEYNETLKKAA